MKKNYLGLFAALLGTAALAGGKLELEMLEPGKLEPGLPPNIAVDIDAPGAARAEIAIAIPSLKEERRFELNVTDEGLVGGIYVPPGKENRISVTLLDARGEKLYFGSGYANVGEKFTRQLDIALTGKETKDPPLAKFGTYRLALDLAVNAGDGLMLQTTLVDATGKHLRFNAEELKWGAFPEKFEVLPYSCFNNSLCFEMPDLSVYEARLACLRDVVCSHQKPRDTRGPYRYVAVGRTHTCALTIDNDILCWGDNSSGQLRASSPATCTVGTRTVPCSLFPAPIVCNPGEVCKFQSVSAGAERTCAVDTDGRLFCWGKSGDIATGEAGTPSAVQMMGEIEAEDASGNKVRFASVDTDLINTCAISANRELYCFLGSPNSPLTDSDIRKKGTQYKTVSVGRRHVCAQTVGNKLDCFGSDFDGQISGTFPVPGPVSPELEQIFKRGGHVPAAGATSTCAQDPDDNTICWGSPVTNQPISTPETGGFIALWRSYAISLSSNTATCQVGVGNFFTCTRTCAVGLGGDLFCGNWRDGATPSQLVEVQDPASDHYISWNQTDVGPNHVCAVNSQRDIWCLGTNGFGQFGTGAVSTARANDLTAPVNRFPNGIATLVFP